MSRRAAFTLIEMLVSVVVLGLIVVLASQMTSGVISTVSQTTQRLDASESVRGAVQALRTELGGVIVSDRPGRFLNLKLASGEKTVSLHFTVPRAQTADFARLGFVEHIAYVWDREARVLLRAAYHSSRDPEAVQGTASSPAGADMLANLTRLRALTPAYRGEAPFEWTRPEFWKERLEHARRNPVLTNLAEWKVECIEDAGFESGEDLAVQWEEANRLPVALRMTFVIDTHARSEAGAGRRFTSLIALPAPEDER